MPRIELPRSNRLSRSGRRRSRAGASREPLRRGSAPPVSVAAFTLVELVVALAVAALLTAMAMPSFRDWLSAYQLANHAKHLAETMTRARTEAVRRNDRVTLCKSPDGRRCADAARWDEGFLVFVDGDHDGRVGADEPVLAVEGPAPPGVTIDANRPLEDYVSYTSLGRARMLNGALQMGTFTLCRSGQRTLRVVLANSGRVRTEKVAAVCP
jgi:type IV fimbrial biogenesis protein FimT